MNPTVDTTTAMIAKIISNAFRFHGNVLSYGLVLKKKYDVKR